MNARTATLKRGQPPPRAAARQARQRPGVGRRWDWRSLGNPGPLEARLISIGLLAVAAAILIGLKLPQRAVDALIAWTARAGWEVRHVELVGVKEQNRLAIYGAALGGGSNAMLATDLDAVRRRLLALPWVADASVERRLPDTLVIRISERRPVALWQLGGKLAAIDMSGRVLTRQRLERWNALPLLVGAGANTRVREALLLLAATPLGRDVDAAIHVGGRRWALRFATGETLDLPDRPAAARAALLRFAALDARGPGRLLGSGFTRFDLRPAGRMIVAGPPVAATLAAQEKAARAARAAAGQAI
jgi:cell division protein FtsQ